MMVDPQSRVTKDPVQMAHAFVEIFERLNKGHIEGDMTWTLIGLLERITKQAATIDQLTAALAQGDKNFKRLGEELEDAEDRRGNEYLKLEDTVAEQAATIEAALRITDNMRSDGWPSGNTVPDLGEKIYRVLSGTPTANPETN